MFTPILGAVLAFQPSMPHLVFPETVAAVKQEKDDYEKVWASCAQAIRTRYYGRVSQKDKMESLLKVYEPKAKQAKSREEFNDILDNMIADFKDSHFDFLTKDDQGYYCMDGFRGEAAEPMPNIGAWFKRADDGYTVTMVLEGMPADEAGIRKGDVITKIDGNSFTPIESLREKVGKTVEINFVRNKQFMECELEVKSDPCFKMFLTATRNSAKIIEDNGKKIGYVHLWTMVNDDFKNELSNLVYGKFNGTDAIILDVRDGFGGRPEGFGDPFFRPGIQLEWMRGPSGSQKQMFGYAKPLVLLVNEGSRSAKEVFSYIMKKSGRATLVGNTTGGFVLGTSPFKVCEWAYLEMPMVDLLVDGERLEGKGVEPNIKLPKETDADGKDLHLEKALELLRKK